MKIYKNKFILSYNQQNNYVMTIMHQSFAQPKTNQVLV